ncbi:hypothetical protein PF327_10765 [Sulfurovum sp. XTW-4]|uniref:Uncharacterized protein n=1 Tax=Sulfurovum xiamenensis TaxID=3019066 RepID=A0ABT7QUA3_9BACT|nr:hypothetical protein [Sulfurovum xiamenensis]MDM5264676.1 hypothetical protein [Sulfurovum xiamenensis]
MATIGEEIGLELVSTNVAESAPTYDANSAYNEGDIVKDGDYLYRIQFPLDIEIGTFDELADAFKGDIVQYNGKLYELTEDFSIYPIDANTDAGFNAQVQGGYHVGDAYSIMWKDAKVGDSIRLPKFSGLNIVTWGTKTITAITGSSYDLIYVWDDSATYPDEYETVTLASFSNSLSKGTQFMYKDTIYMSDYEYSIAGDYVNYPPGTSVVPNRWVPVEYRKVLISYINPLKVFDGANINPAIHDGSVSDMQYVIKGLEEFNAFTLAKVLASSLTYTFTLPVGDPDYGLWLNGSSVASGGNGIVKTDTVSIDCTRDAAGILSDYPTTVIFYADMQMPVNSTVTITLSYGSIIQIGDFTMNNTVSDGLTNLEFSHAIQDYNDYTPDAWGGISEGVKAVVTKFNITMDVNIEDYDRMVSFHESIIRKFVTVDGSDSGTAVAGSKIFNSLTRRVLITSVSSKTVNDNGRLGQKGVITLSAREIV